ncbi:uncharacterized protein [Paramormyrops kingsleyae]|uniref:uncharacterized protein isoform X2 n=1 Tax=Paramormyrops kingsleyae TaxID=1676925 RepID=UPI003B96D26E
MADNTLKWTDEQTLQLIQLRIENEHLFTGHRNASVNGFDEIIKKMDLEGKVTAKQAAKKWENLKKKYKDLMAAMADQWPFFSAMHAAVCQKPATQPLHVIASCTSTEQAALPMATSDTDDTKDPGDFSAWTSGTATDGFVADDSVEQSEQSLTSSIGQKRKRSSLLDYLKKESEREEKRFKDAEARETARHEENQRQMNRLLSAFERMVEKM